MTPIPENALIMRQIESLPSSRAVVRDDQVDFTLDENNPLGVFPESSSSSSSESVKSEGSDTNDPELVNVPSPTATDVKRHMERTQEEHSANPEYLSNEIIKICRVAEIMQNATSFFLRYKRDIREEHFNAIMLDCTSENHGEDLAIAMMKGVRMERAYKNQDMITKLQDLFSSSLDSMEQVIAVHQVNEADVSSLIETNTQTMDRANTAISKLETTLSQQLSRSIQYPTIAAPSASSSSAKGDGTTPSSVKIFSLGPMSIIPNPKITGKMKGSIPSNIANRAVWIGLWTKIMNLPYTTVQKLSVLDPKGIKLLQLHTDNPELTGMELIEKALT